MQKEFVVDFNDDDDVVEIKHENHDDTINSIKEAFKRRNEFIQSFEKYLKEKINCEMCFVGGSYVRKRLEFCFQKQIQVGGYGDPRGHDIDIFIASNIPDRETQRELKDRFNNLFINLCLLLNINLKKKIKMLESHEKIQEKYVRFGDYVLDVVVNSNDQTYNINQDIQDVPHIKLIFYYNGIKGEDDLHIDILGWRSDFDFNVNSLLIDSDGTLVGNNYLEIMQCIGDKRAVMKEWNFPLERTIKNFHSFCLFVSNRIPRMLHSGYTITAKKLMPCYSFEEKNPCPYTNCPAPYPVIQFYCSCNNREGIKLSVMKIYEIFNSNDKKVCPECKRQLEIKWINLENDVEEHEPIDVVENEKEELNIGLKEADEPVIEEDDQPDLNHKYISAESQKYVFNFLKKRPRKK